MTAHIVRKELRQLFLGNTDEIPSELVLDLLLSLNDILLTAFLLEP